MVYFGLWFADKIAGKIEEGFRALMFILSSLCYELVIFFYNIFTKLGTAEILTTSQIEKIYSRVTLILGMFMLFKMIFSFIQYLLNPDLLSDKSKGAGKLITKAIIVVALLGTTPFIFRQAYALQKAVLESNIIGKVVLGLNDANSDVSDFGGDLASYMFFSFYSFNEGEVCDDQDIDMDAMKEEVTYAHTFDLAKTCLNDRGSSEDFVINFPGNGVLSLVVGIFVLYIILSYCLSVGIRVIQLAFLQLIAPIPILSYLGEDKDGAFSKWIKRCISTFIDLFIRMAIIYFVVYIISLLMSDTDSYYWLLASTGNPTGMTKFWLVIIIIIGLLLFAKKAPELFKEVLPGMGNNIGFGLNFGKDLKTAWDSTKKPLSYGKRAVGFVGGGQIGAVKSSISRFNSNRSAGNGFGKSLLGAAGGFVSGMYLGTKSGMQKGSLRKNLHEAVKNTRTADNQYESLIYSGGSTLGKYVSKLVDNFGRTKGQAYTKIIGDAKTIGSYRDDAYTAAEKVSAVASAKSAMGHIQQEAGESKSQFLRRQSRVSNSYDNMADAAFNAAADGKSYYSWLEEEAFNFSGIKGAFSKLSYSSKNIRPLSGFKFDASGVDSNDLNAKINMQNEFSAKLDKCLQAYQDAGGNVSAVDKSKILADFNSSFSSGQRTFDLSDLSKYVDIEKDFSAELDKSIAEFVSNGGDATSIDKNKIVSDFVASGLKDTSVNIGSQNDYMNKVKASFAQSLQREKDSYIYMVSTNNGISAEDKKSLIAEMEKNYQLQLDNFDSSFVDALNTESTEIEYKMGSINVFSDSDSRRIAQVQSGLAQAKSFADATGAKYYDQKTGEYVDYVFNSGEDFRSAGKKRDNTVSHVTSQPDYRKAIADDKAAGVDSNVGSKK